MRKAHSAGDELVVDVEVAHLVALPIGVNLLEHRLEVQVQAAIAALVHDPRHGRCAGRTVRHLYARSNQIRHCLMNYMWIALHNNLICSAMDTMSFTIYAGPLWIISYQVHYDSARITIQDYTLTINICCETSQLWI